MKSGQLLMISQAAYIVTLGRKKNRILCWRFGHRHAAQQKRDGLAWCCFMLLPFAYAPFVTWRENRRESMALARESLTTWRKKSLPGFFRTRCCYFISNVRWFIWKALSALLLHAPKYFCSLSIAWFTFETAWTTPTFLPATLAVPLHWVFLCWH